MMWKTRREVYSGEWKDNHPNGYGEYVWMRNSKRADQFPFHNSYSGLFRNGKRHGQVIFVYASGARYIGNWVNDLKHGYGIYISENGRRYEGEFRNDQIVGIPMDEFNGERPFQFVQPPTPLILQDAPGEVQKALNSVVLRHVSK